MYNLKLISRYVFRQRIAYLAMIAVAVCSFTVVIVMTVLSGLVGDHKQKNHSWVGDCVVVSSSLTGFEGYHDFAELLSSSHVAQAVSPVIRTFGMLTTQGGYNENVELMGIDPDLHCKVTGFAESLHFHKDCSQAFTPAYGQDYSGVVVGIGLLGWSPDEFEGFRTRQSMPQIAMDITTFPLTAKGTLARGGGMGLVSSKQFWFSDDSMSGIANIDGSFVYLPFDEAQILCGMDGAKKRAHAIFIKFPDGTALDDGVNKTADLWQKFSEDNPGVGVAGVSVQSWKSYRRDTIAAMEKEELMMTAVFILVGVITVFIVFVIFYMIVSHKLKDIGILKSFGASTGSVVRLFSGFAALTGLIGALAGISAGLLFLEHINEVELWLYNKYGFQIWDRTMYMIDDIPNELNIELLVVVAMAAVTACVAGAFFPSLKAGRLKCVDSLRVNGL